jgi:Flp pilus assembly protein TadD
MRTFWILIAITVGCAGSKAELSPRDAHRLRRELAQTYIQHGAFIAALPLVQQEVAEHPGDPDLHVLYATVLRERGLYPQAERELLAVLRLAPRHAAAWAGLGLTCDLMRLPRDAERAHRMSVEIAPGVAAYWNNLGFSLFLAKRDDEAIPALERALALDPSLTVAYNNLGFAYGRRGDYERSRRYFRAALGETAADLNLALVYERNGNPRAAERLRARVESEEVTR